MAEWAYENSCFQLSEYYVNLVLSSKPDDMEIIADCLSRACILQQRKGNLAAAIEYAERCLDIDRDLGNPENISSSLNNIAGLYLTFGQSDIARQYIDEAIAVERPLGRAAIPILKAANNLNSLLIAYAQVGEICLRSGRDHDAWLILEGTADNGTQYLKYSYSVIGNFDISKNKVGSNWDYYRIMAVATRGGAYIVDITDCVGRVVAYACDWHGKDADGNRIECGAFGLSSIAEMIKHIKDEDEKVSASHPHHDTHDYFCQFSSIVHKADVHGLYCVPLFLLRVKE